MLFGPPYWISDLLPVICIVFEQPIKTAPRTDLSRVVRFVKPCAVRNEDSRYEIERHWNFNGDASGVSCRKLQTVSGL